MRASLRENRLFSYAKTKTQISFAVTAKLISVFVFATRIVQSLYYLNLKFQASSHLMWLYRPVCVGPDRKPRRPVFSERGSYKHALHYDNMPMKYTAIFHGFKNVCFFFSDDILYFFSYFA